MPRGPPFDRFGVPRGPILVTRDHYTHKINRVFDFSLPATFWFLGKRFVGKSTGAEDIGIEYIEEKSEFSQGGTVIDIFSCYDEKTEALTERGWKPIAQISLEDKVATRNAEGFIEYHRPTATQKFWFEGEMVRFGGAHSRYDLLVTPNHRMLIRRFGGEKIFRAEELLRVARNSKRVMLYGIQRTARWKGNDVEFVELPGKRRYEHTPQRIMIDAFLRFFGWYIAEGFVRKDRKSKRINIVQCKPAYYREIEEAVEKMGFNYFRDGHTVAVSSNQLASMCEPLGCATEKYIPDWIKNLPTSRLEILLGSMMKGDGNAKNLYYTSSPKLAQDFEEIAIKCGYAVTTSVREPPGKLPAIWGREIRTVHDNYCISISKQNPNLTSRNVKEEVYSGFVYDINVPNHVFMVRRNGKAVWSGNSDDDEGAAWIRSGYWPILFICGNKVDLKYDKERYPRLDWCHIGELKAKSPEQAQAALARLEKYKVVVTVPSFYFNPNEMFHALSDLIDLLKLRGKSKWTVDGKRKILCVIVREAKILLASRYWAGAVQSRQDAEMDLIDLNDKAYHTGLALAFDSLRFTSITPEVRDIADYTFIKRLGRMKIPKELNYILRYARPRYLRRMPKAEFVLYTDTDDIYSGHNAAVKWHVNRGEAPLDLLGIKPEYNVNASRPATPEGAAVQTTIEEANEVQSKKWKVAVAIHKRIVQLVIVEGFSVRKAADKLEHEEKDPIKLSISTVHAEVKSHRSGLCLCVVSSGGMVAPEGLGTLEERRN